jgi:amino acid adenylation domain-containing protein
VTDPSVWSAFVAVADARPDAPALITPAGTATYAQLRSRAEAVASVLLAEPAFSPARWPDARPALVLARHDEAAVAAMLGIAAAGGCWLVLDPSAPAGYLERIVARHGSGLMLADRRHQDRAAALVGTSGSVVLADAAPVDGPTADRRPAVAVDPWSPLSVSYTSGTSGRPKAVLHSHRNIAQNALSYGRAIDAGPADRFLVTSPLASVAAATPLFTALLGGGTACLVAFPEHGAGGVARLADTAGVTVAHVPSATLEALAAARPQGLPGVRLVSLGGDRLLPHQVQAARTAFPRATLLHRYSTSETNWIAGHRIEPDDPLPDGPVPLGVPVPWADVSVVDASGEPVRDGEAGELVVRGDHLALGYLDDPELTAERFAEDGRAYRTGDRVRRRPGGALEFAGRRDDVVKVRGVLVDLAAVERALRSVGDVREAAVVAIGGDRVEVAGFVVGDGLRAWQVRAVVAASLPAAMVPAQIVVLPELPLTARGKVDRDALRAMGVGRPPFAEPADGLERAIAGEVASVLSVEPVGRDDDVFALGADSLATAELIERLEPVLGRALRAADLLEHPTPALLAQWSRVAADAGPDRRHARLVKVADGPVDRPIAVMFTGGGGGFVAGMSQLARAMSPRRCYVVVPRGFDHRGPADRTVPRMARSAATAVRSLLAVEVVRSVVLIGHSAGGTVALETARQLRGAGVEVRLVILLDTLALTERVKQVRSMGPDIRYNIRTGTRIRAERGQGTSAARKAFWALRLPLRRLQRRWLAATAGTLPRSGQSQVRAFHALIKVATRRWVDGPYEGRVHLVRASDASTDPRGSAADLGWGEVLREGLTTSSTTSGHSRMTTGANAVTTAAEIDRVCVEVESGEA